MYCKNVSSNFCRNISFAYAFRLRSAGIFAVLLDLWLVRLAEFTKNLYRVQFRHSLAISPKRTIGKKSLCIATGKGISNYRSCSSYHKTFCTITFIIVTIFSFSTPAVAEEVATGAITDEIVLVAGKLPDAAITEGDWVWDEAVVQDGIISHTDLSHEGRNTRSFTTSSKVSLGENSKVVQYIFLDAENPPLGIMLKLKIEGLEDAISLYWEGDKEVFADMNEYITAWYMGVLPEAGKWVELIIDCKELELEKAGLSGMSFIAHEGKVWWGKTIIKEVEYVKEKT